MGITVAQDRAALSHWYAEHITDYHTRYQFPLRAGGGKGSNYAELPHYLVQAGFSDVQVLKERVDFDYTSVEEWWEARWTHGPRYALEHMTPEVLAQFKAEVLARLHQQEEEPGNGIRETLLIQHFIAHKEI